MPNRYLLNVLGLNALPRIVTFGLTLVSFPLMVRALGAAEYGVVTYLSSIALLLESFADSGVTAATGKALAALRAHKPAMLSASLFLWLKLQLLVAFAGFVVSLVVGYGILKAGGPGNGRYVLYLYLALTTFVAIGTTFVRVSLSSLLAFKKAAIMDTAESVLRSLGWFVVAFIAPTAMALAIVGLIGSVTVLLLGVPMLRSSVRDRMGDDGAADVDAFRATITGEMWRDSIQFFGVRFATRAFQTLPLFLIGRAIGEETVGIIGAFNRIAETVSLPITLIANALAVRAHEVRLRGAAAIATYWQVVIRVAVAALAAAGGVLLISTDLAQLIVPSSGRAATLFKIMSFLLFAQLMSALFSPASDYIGGLGRRAKFLIICAVLQAPVVWSGAKLFGDVGAVVAMTLSYWCMSVGYIIIARHVFFQNRSQRLPQDVPIAISAILTTLSFCTIVKVILDATAYRAPLSTHNSVIAFCLYLAILVAIAIAVPPLHRVYRSFKFLDF